MIRILIVEDNPHDRELLFELLSSSFMQQAKFRMASDLNGALTYLRRTHPPAPPDVEDSGPYISGPYFDCILLDLQLPDSSGRQTFDAIFQAFAHIPIIIVSHNKSQALAVELVEAGAEDFVLKDFSDTTDVFRRVLFAVVRSRRRQSNRISLIDLDR